MQSHMLTSDFMKFLTFCNDANLKVEIDITNDNNERIHEGPVTVKLQTLHVKYHKRFYFKVDPYGEIAQMDVIHNFCDEHYFQPVDSIKCAMIIVCNDLDNLLTNDEDRNIIEKLEYQFEYYFQ